MGKIARERGSVSLWSRGWFGTLRRLRGPRRWLVGACRGPEGALAKPSRTSRRIGRLAIAMSTLERAIQIACKAHEGQLDKGGDAYILHPLRAMLRMSTQPTRIAAVLHDVVEDSGCTLEDLAREGFSLEVRNAVDALTRREGEDYLHFVRRAAADPVAGPVKRADLEDNLDLGRIKNPTDRDRKRARRYERALDLLTECGVP